MVDSSALTAQFEQNAALIRLKLRMSVVDLPLSEIEWPTDLPHLGLLNKPTAKGRVHFRSHSAISAKA